MPRTPTLALLLVALLAAPSASAWPWDDDMTITVAASHAGDMMRYQGFSEDAPGGPTTIILVEGPARAVDANGAEVDTIALRIDRFHDNGTLENSQRCHRALATRDSVRHDFLGGEPEAWSAQSSGTAVLGLGAYSRSETQTTVAGFWPYPCQGVNDFGGQQLREGQQLPLRFFFGDAADEGFDPDLLSFPARAGEFHGRASLTIAFDVAVLGGEAEGYTGELGVVFADGLPDIVEFYANVADAEGNSEHEGMRLLGFQPGDGAPIPPPGPSAPEDVNPFATFNEYDPRAFDDAAFTLAFPYAEAYQAILDDTTDTWLAEHPDAHVAAAFFEIESQSDDAVDTQSPGTWTIIFEDPTEIAYYMVSRVDAVRTPLAAIDMPVRRYIVNVIDNAWENEEPLTQTPPPLVDSATILQLAAAHGVETPITVVGYMVASYEGEMYTMGVVSDMRYDQDRDVGRTIYVDLSTGRVVSVLEGEFETTTSPLLVNVAELPESEGSSAFSALAGPGVGAGLGLPAAAATGVALLLIAAKFLLVPLFTRLRRDRLLDNEVRARLYERIRAEPGIHRAELVDFAGIGEGATRHHLQQMVTHKLLLELEDGGFMRYFAAGEVPPDVARRESALRAGSQRRVYDLYSERPDVTLREAGAILGMSAPSVHRAKRKLEKAGLLPAAATASISSAEA